MSDEEKKSKEDVVGQDVRRVLLEKRDLQNENDKLGLHIRELETQLSDERHDFKRKQIGMSTLVAVLMDARFDGGERVHINRDEFVRLATEASSKNEDNKLLREKLDEVREELRLVRSQFVTHKMAIQESTGIKLAEVIYQRDNLKAALMKQIGTGMSDEMMGWIDEILDRPLVKQDEDHVNLPNAPMVMTGCKSSVRWRSDY